MTELSGGPLLGPDDLSRALSLARLGDLHVYFPCVCCVTPGDRALLWTGRPAWGSRSDPGEEHTAAQI